MRKGELVLGGLLTAALLGTAACSQGNSTDPGTPAGSGDNATGVDSIATALATRKDSDYIDLADLEHACGSNSACLAELANFKSFLAERCPTQAGCNYSPAMILYLTRNSEQIAHKAYTSNFPQVAAVKVAYEDMTGKSVGGAGGTGGGTSGPPVDKGPLDAVLAEIGNTGGTVTIDQIAELAQKLDPTTADALMKAIKAALAGIQPTAAARPIADNLLKGQAVTATEAVVTMRVVADEVTAALGGSAGGASQPSGAGASADLAKLVAPVVTMLTGTMATQQVTWSAIEDLISQSDPSGGSDLADRLQAALAKLPPLSPNFEAAQALVKGDAVTGAAAGAALTEAAATR
jgi:hypothetical protein